MEKKQTPMKIPGFRFSAVKCGIKKANTLDLGLIVSDVPATAAGTFTTNRVQAAPVVITRERIRSGSARAILVNSGNANACNGARGDSDARALSADISRMLGLKNKEVLLASTGVIGHPLPLARIQKALPALGQGLGPNRGAEFARCILTTDTFPKIVYRKMEISRKRVTIMGIAKGAGMIMPNMATMLAFVLTDLAIPSRLLRPLFKSAVDDSFNRITIDGDTSTNDSAICLANGMAGNTLPRGNTLSRVEDLLAEMMRELARCIVLDGEGATRLIEVEVRGARTIRDAGLAARTVANSLLCKTAFHGAEVNWGRIIAALGRSDARINPGKIDVNFDSIPVVRSSRGCPANDHLARAVLKKKQFHIRIHLHQGRARSSVLTCDLSSEYIRINAGYLS